MSKKSIKDREPNNVRCGIGLQRQRMKESFRRGLIQWLQEDLVISLCINWNENENLHCSKIIHQIHNNHYKFPHAQVPKSSTNFTQLYFIKVYVYSTYDFKIRSTSTRFGVSFDPWICALDFSYASWKLHYFPYLDVKNTLCQITLQAKVDVVGNVVQKVSLGGLEGFRSIHKQFHQLVGLFVCSGTTLLVEKFIQAHLMIILDIWCVADFSSFTSNIHSNKMAFVLGENHIQCEMGINLGSFQNKSRHVKR